MRMTARMRKLMIMMANVLLVTFPTSWAFLPHNTRFLKLVENVNNLDGSKSIADAVLHISALGRPLHPGTLYNALKDQLVPGINLWKTSDIQNKTKIHQKPETKVAVQASESLSEKTNLLNVEASVKAGFFSGLVEVGGSAKYLNKKTTSTLQSSLTFRHHETTQYKELLLTDLPPPDHLIPDKMDATHVVVGVMYGADAIMEFQQMASDQKDKEVIEGNLNIMIKKIPSIEISGNGSLNMTNEEKAKVEKFSCTFYGDFHLDNLPSTFEEAVKVYKTLPSLLGKHMEKAVPLKVWLYPLSKLLRIESKLKTMIEETLVGQLGQRVDDLHHAKIRAYDLLEKSRGVKTKDISYKLKQFIDSLEMFTSDFLMKLSKLIPGIRGGEIKETALVDVLHSDLSGFNREQMHKWLDGKEMEIEVISMYINKLLPLSVKPPGLEFDTYIVNPDVTFLCVFSFTSLDYEEPYLKKIVSSGVNFNRGSISFQREQDQSQEIPWYRRSEVRKTLTHLVDVFKNHCNRNRIVSYISDSKHPIASIRKYQKGVLVNPQVQAKYLPFYLNTCRLTFDPDTADTNVLLSESNTNVKYIEDKQPYPERQERFKKQQVMSREALDERCYWEVEWTGLPDVAVAYKSIGRHDYIEGDAKAWCLSVKTSGPVMVHGNVKSKLSVTLSDFGRVGVYLDRGAGTLSFYGVSTDGETHTHLHTFNTTFNHEPIHAVFYVGSSTSLTLH